MRIFSWDSTAFTSCSLLQIKVRAPTRSPGEEEREEGEKNGEREGEWEKGGRGKERRGGKEGKAQDEKSSTVMFTSPVHSASPSSP